MKAEVTILISDKVALTAKKTTRDRKYIMNPQ